jgi:hypothetical protein
LEIVTARDLTEESVFDKLNELLINKYDSIYKIQCSEINHSKVNTVSDMKDALVALSIKKQGYNNVMGLMREIYEAGHFNRNEYYSRCKNMIKENQENYRVENEDYIIDELDNLIYSCFSNS